MKIYKKGNYIYLVNASGDIKQDHANEVKITKTNVSNETYSIYSDDLGVNNVTFSELTQENGTAYASVQAFELWYAENTGFNPASGGSGAGTVINTVSNYASLPDPTLVSNDFYWCEASQGTKWLPFSVGGTYYPLGMYYSNGVTWEYSESPYQATLSEVNTGTNTDKFVSASTFANATKWNNYQNKTNEFIFVSSKSDLPIAISNVITLLDSVTYFFTTTVDLTGDRLVCGLNTVILGASSENCYIKSTGLNSATALITSVYSLPIRNISFTHGTVFNLDGDGTTTAIDWFGINFVDCATIGTIKDYTNFVMGDSAFLNSSGMTFDGSIGTIAFGNCLFDSSTGGTAITLASTLTVTRRFRIIYSSFVTLSGETSLNVSASATISDERYILDTVNFSGGGSYILGVDQTSNKTLFTNCVGIQNTTTRGFYYMVNNATDTIIGGPNVNVWVKALGTTTADSNNSKFSHSNNRLTYSGAFNTSFLITVNTAVRSGASNQNISIGIAKNGTILTNSEMTIRTSTSNQEHPGSTQYQIDLITNDYVELFVKNSQSTDIRVSDLNFSVVKILV
jgi:hypothetical protein